MSDDETLLGIIIAICVTIVLCVGFNLHHEEQMAKIGKHCTAEVQ
jgi:hypothetical protein